MKPDLKQAREFLAVLDTASNAQFGFRTLPDRRIAGEADQRLAILCRGTLDKGERQSGNPEKHGRPCRPSALLDYMAEKWGAGVFVVVNEIDARGQRAENVTRVRALHVDCDDDLALRNLQHFISATRLDPTILVASGGITDSGAEKIQCYWRVDGCALDEFGHAQLSLISRVGSDPAVHNLSRVLRLPGYWHRKKDPRMTRLVAIDPRRVYDFTSFMQTVKRQPVAVRLPATMSNGTRAGRVIGSPPRRRSTMNARMRELERKHRGLVIPALDALISEAVGPSNGPGNRHETLKTVVGKLGSRAWSADEITTFVLPRINQKWGDGDWSRHLASVVHWAVSRDQKLSVVRPNETF